MKTDSPHARPEVNFREEVERPSLPRQTPYRRTYLGGRVTWIACYFDLEGVAHYAKPDWNDGKSAFKLRWKAQQAIDEALGELHGAPPGARVWREL